MIPVCNSGSGRIYAMILLGYVAKLPDKVEHLRSTLFWFSSVTQ